jgi:hypothetical protein
MQYPVPRTDRWDPWIAATVLLVLAAAAVVLRLFV